MAAESTLSAADFLPVDRSLAALSHAAGGCRGCELYRQATQVVFGEGPADARLMLVAEMPGDAEDRSGRPFVGPAGAMLDRALLASGIERLEVYITNAVKHFRFLAASGRRLHKTPAASHLHACYPWLEAQLQAIRPLVTVCLGASALHSVLGHPATIASLRGKPRSDPLAGMVIATLHPSAIVRMRDHAQRERALSGLTKDLRLAQRLAKRLASRQAHGRRR